MRVLDLFSGIGGFSLGLERAGMATVAFCEKEEFPRQVLAKHWPGIPIYKDVLELTGEQLEKEVGPIDLICGGFPCQDISNAGLGAGLSGKRSGLWFEFARLIKEVGPEWVIIENVAALRSKGLVIVLQNLWSLGYDAEWHCIPASAVGAPHQRDRIWIVAHATGKRYGKRRGSDNILETNGGSDRSVRSIIGGTGKNAQDMAYTNSRHSQAGCESAGRQTWPDSIGCGSGSALADSTLRGRYDAQAADRQQTPGRNGSKGPVGGCGGFDHVADPIISRSSVRQSLSEIAEAELQTAQRDGNGGRPDQQWPLEPGLGRGYDGISSWLDGSWEWGVPRVTTRIPGDKDGQRKNRVGRLKALGNAVVPQIPELIGRVIMKTSNAPVTANFWEEFWLDFYR